MNELQNKETMSSLQIAEIVCKPHYDVLKAIRKMEKAWHEVCGGNFSVTSVDTEMPNGGVRQTPCYELTKAECLYIATKFNDTARARLVLRWKQLEEERIAGTHQPSFDTMNPIQQKMAVADWAVRFLNLNENSKLLLAQTICQEVGLEMAVPQYTPSNGTLKSATELLRANNIPMSAIAFNKQLEAKGFLVSVTRRSSRGEKKYHSITEKGLAYGENQVCPQNPKETQPLWYEDKFSTLLNQL